MELDLSAPTGAPAVWLPTSCTAMQNRNGSRSPRRSAHTPSGTIITSRPSEKMPFDVQVGGRGWCVRAIGQLCTVGLAMHTLDNGSTRCESFPSRFKLKVIRTGGDKGGATPPPAPSELKGAFRYCCHVATRGRAWRGCERGAPEGDDDDDDDDVLSPSWAWVAWVGGTAWRQWERKRGG